MNTKRSTDENQKKFLWGINVSIIKKAIIITAIICFLIPLSIYMLILYNSVNTSPKKSDVMIVLGCQIKNDGPSLMLKNRLKKALELYSQGYADEIIVSGGKGANEPVTEAEGMKDWLVAHGIDSSKIIEESKSTSTYENLKFSKMLMQENGFKTALIVSSDFHMFRAMHLAKRLGISASGAAAPIPAYLKPYYHVREIFSCMKNFLLYGFYESPSPILVGGGLE